jgi:hypothetical protein
MTFSNIDVIFSSQMLQWSLDSRDWTPRFDLA